MIFLSGAAQTFIQKSNTPLLPVLIYDSTSPCLSLHLLSSRVAESSSLRRCVHPLEKDISNQQLSTRRPNIFPPHVLSPPSHPSLLTHHFLPLSPQSSFYLILRHYSHLPLSVNYVLFLVILLPQWSYNVLFSVSDSTAVSSQLFYKPGSRTDSDATLQVAVTLLC